LLKTVVLLHVYYADLWQEIALQLHRLDPFPWKLYVNAVEGQVQPWWVEQVVEEFAHAEVFISPNRGLDVGGTVNLIHRIDFKEFDLVLKIHTKRSYYSSQRGDTWRKEMLQACLQDPHFVVDLFARDLGVSMIGSKQWLIQSDLSYCALCAPLCVQLGFTPPKHGITFFAGSMFWCRGSLMERIQRLGIRQSDFAEGYSRDGTLAHIIERLFGVLGQLDGKLVGN
jgi:lipopolysaccharide biosynthesis protein